MISIYHGVVENWYHNSLKEFNSRERLLKNKLCGEGQNIRSLIIEKLRLQIEVIQHVKR
jgi:hypothetical protein